MKIHSVFGGLAMLAAVLPVFASGAPVPEWLFTLWNLLPLVGFVIVGVGVGVLACVWFLKKANPKS